MTAPRAKQGMLRGLVLENIGLKVVSLATALAIFSLVRGAENETRPFFVDVIAVVPDPSSGRMLLSDVPERVRVTLRGSSALLRSLRAHGLPPIQVDLHDTEQRLYYFDAESVEVPPGVEVVEIAPATISLQWADRAQRSLPVRPSIEGQPGPGLMVAGNPVARPPTVTVTGPAPEISPLEHVTTDPISIAGLEVGRHERRVPLMRLPPHAEYEGEPFVSVTIEIVPQIAERTLPRLEVAVVGGTVRELRPARVRVRLRGPPAVLDALDPLVVVPYVDATALEPTGGAQPVPVRVRGVPDGIELVDVEPADVLATLR